jgi:hypothetical protein
MPRGPAVGAAPAVLDEVVPVVARVGAGEEVDVVVVVSGLVVGGAVPAPLECVIVGLTPAVALTAEQKGSAAGSTDSGVVMTVS